MGPHLLICQVIDTYSCSYDGIRVAENGLFTRLLGITTRVEIMIGFLRLLILPVYLYRYHLIFCMPSSLINYHLHWYIKIEPKITSSCVPLRGCNSAGRKSPHPIVLFLEYILQWWKLTWSGCVVPEPHSSREQVIQLPYMMILWMLIVITAR